MILAQLNITLQQLDRIDARIEQGFHCILIGTLFVIAAASLSIYRNWKYHDRHTPNVDRKRVS